MFPSKFHQYASSHCDQVKISFRRWTMKNSKSFSRWNLDLALQLLAQALSWDGCVLFLSDSVCWVILYPPCVGAPKSDKRLEFWGCPRDEQTWIVSERGFAFIETRFDHSEPLVCPSSATILHRLKSDLGWIDEQPGLQERIQNLPRGSPYSIPTSFCAAMYMSQQKTVRHEGTWTFSERMAKYTQLTLMVISMILVSEFLVK